MARYGKGRLFEPKSINMSDMAAAKAFEIFNGDFFRIGVNDIVQPDTYVYESNSVPITFTPNWYSSSASYRPGNKVEKNKCIIVGSNSDALGEWVDYPCSNTRYSICE